MTAIQICALLSLILGATLLYWVGYRDLIDGRAEDHRPLATDGPTGNRTSVEGGMKSEQHTTEASTALSPNVGMVDAPETKSLCRVAAGITKPVSATAEALIPHEKLREAATPDATLIAQTRPPAQLVVGYKLALPEQNTAQQLAVDELQIDERAEFENEFPVPEGVQYCRQRGTYISSPGASTSDTFARELYAYRAGLAGWLRRSWKRNVLDAVRPVQVHLATKKCQEEA
jgi:hypothetical protein